MLVALLILGLSAGPGLGAGGLLGPRHPRLVLGAARWLRWIAAGSGSLVALAFAAGVVGALAQGGPGPLPLVVFALALLGAAALLWRGPERHLAVWGHWLGSLWWLWALTRAHSPVLALLFLPVAYVALLASALESGASRPRNPADPA